MSFVMDYLMLCHICGTEYTAKQDSCSHCGSSNGAIFVHPSLVIVVTRLIKLGLNVLDTDVKYCTSHKTTVIIQLAGNLPEGIFSDLPEGWQVNNLCQLRCSDTDRSKMIKDLEDWAMSKDIDGFRAILKLSGYDIGQ